MFDEWNETVQ